MSVLCVECYQQEMRTHTSYSTELYSLIILSLPPSQLDLDHIDVNRAHSFTKKHQLITVMFYRLYFLDQIHVRKCCIRSTKIIQRAASASYDTQSSFCINCTHLSSIISLSNLVLEVSKVSALVTL